MPEMRWNGRRWGIAGALAAGLVLAAGSGVRVPEGSVGVTEGGLLRPGWHLRAPFRAVPLIPERGDVVSDRLDLRTREGSTITFRLDLAYRLGARLAPSLVRDIRSAGFTSAIEGLARHVLLDAGGRLDAESLLAN